VTGVPIWASFGSRAVLSWIGAVASRSDENGVTVGGNCGSFIGTVTGT
jgi:hypothetical protein